MCCGLSVCLCLLVMTEPIEMLFGSWTVGSREPCIRLGPILPPTGRGTWRVILSPSELLAVDILNFARGSNVATSSVATFC